MVAPAVIIIGGIAARVAARALAKHAAKKVAQAAARKAAKEAAKRAAKEAAKKSKGCVKGCPKNLTVKAKDGWTPRQMGDAKRKVDALNKSNLRVNKKINRGTSEASKFKKINGKTGKRSDIDHKQDLQLGGKDQVSNMWKLDRSVNRSVGTQIQYQIKDLKHGTKIGKVKLVK